MIAYLDSSILLRWALRQPDRLRELARIEKPFSSKLVRVDCHRALDRLWHSGEVDARQFKDARRQVEKFLGVMALHDVDDDVLDLATEPAGTAIGSLEALHLATARLHGGATSLAGSRLRFATHDPILAHAARELNFDVLGA